MSKNESEVLQDTENAPVASETESVPHLGESVSLKAHIINHPGDEEEDEESLPPMTPEDFEKAIRAVDNLGLAWTPDITPGVKAKTPDFEANLLSAEFEKIQDEYPRLPYEVYLATSFFLMGNVSFAEPAGGLESLKRKGEIAGEIIVTSEYRSTFFFRSAIKVPYLRDIDWEVVFKLHERGVKGIPGIAYGLLALSLQDPFYGSRARTVSHLTVAVDETLVNNLLKILTEVKARLAIARRQADILIKQELLEAKDDPQS